MKRHGRLAVTMAVLAALAFAPAVVASSSQTGLGISADQDTQDESAIQFESLLTRTGALGSYISRNGRIVVVVPTSGTSSFTTGDAARLGLTVTIEHRDIELSDVERIKQLVTEVDWTPPPSVFKPVGLFSAELGKVRIFTDAPIDEFASILKEFEDKVEFVGIPLARLSRVEDYSPHWGGAKMVSPSFPNRWCTSGFGVWNASGNSRMVTAAHCWYPLGVTVNSPEGSSFGTVTRRDAYPSNDFELVGGGGYTQGGSIYVGGSVGTRKKVASAGDPNWTDLYCFSGVTSTEECGIWLVDSNEPLCDPDGCTTNTMVFDSIQGSGSCQGDSGAPFYRYGNAGNIQIRGIVIGGLHFANDPDNSICKANARMVIIEKWSKIRDTYNVTIRTDT